MILPIEVKQAIYDSAYRYFVDWYGAELARQGSCLYWAQVTMKTVLIAGLEPILQAGSMSWPIVEPWQDDGVSPTHFTYQWSPGEDLSAQAIAAGQMPEMHVWCGLKETDEIVDFSTGSFLRLAIDRHGLTWKAKAPPRFLWGKPPERAVYEPNLEATKFAWKTLIKGTHPELFAK